MNDLSDHFSIATIIKNSEPVKIQPKVCVRDTLFASDLEVNLQKLTYTLIVSLHLNVPMQMFCIMNSLLFSTMYRCIRSSCTTLQSNKKRSKTKPWITKGI